MRNAIEALESLGEQIGLGKLEFDEDGVCGLVIGEDMEIFFHGESDGAALRLTGVLGDIDDDQPALALRLLELNAGDGDNGPSAFAVDPDTGEILLVRMLAISEMTPEKMLSAVEKFVERVQYWIRTLPQMILDDAPAPEEFSAGAMIIRG
jgi:hypothetical protein